MLPSKEREMTFRDVKSGDVIARVISDTWGKRDEKRSMEFGAGIPG